MNIPQSILSKLDLDIKLHNQINHPIEIIKKKIYEYFDTLDIEFAKFDDLSPIVSTNDNFDKLLISKDHPARSKSDTYYFDDNTVLRTHTSAHQNELFAKGYHNFLVTGDVYRKDEVDRFHYPVFHQMEGVIMVKDNNDPVSFLQEILVGLTKHLFPTCEDYRFNDDYFPFTHPSYELEIKYNSCDNKWIEVLGCGQVHKQILENNHLDNQYIAFGLGLERLAMILFAIPDIRYFWSNDRKFLDQFATGNIVTFVPYSNLDCISNDISFWIPKDKIVDGKWLDENDFFEQIRSICENWIEGIELADQFIHPKTGKTSRMYRLIYSPYDTTIKDPAEFRQLVLDYQNQIRSNLDKQMDIILR